MFVTQASFEQYMPPALTGEGWRHWRAMSLSSNLPWYLLQHKLPSRDVDLTQTTAVAWETTLHEALEAIDENLLVGLSILAIDSRSGHWSLRRVTEVWSATHQEIQAGSSLAFKLENGDKLTTGNFKPVSSFSAQRRLLARLT